jgi:plasmid stability protein
MTQSARGLRSARAHGVSAEAEHRRLLEAALPRPKRRRSVYALADVPDVGCDEDFARPQDETVPPVFD